MAKAADGMNKAALISASTEVIVRRVINFIVLLPSRLYGVIVREEVDYSISGNATPNSHLPQLRD
jgi:hypothetical protein